MTRREFLDRLDRCLAELEDGERAGMVEFYREQIDDRVDDGMDEEEAVASLENPEDIAANILASRAEEGGGTRGPGEAGASGGTLRRKHPVLRGLGRTILGFIGVLVGIMLLPVVLGAAVCVVAAYLCLWVANAALAASSIVFALFGGLVVASCFIAPAATGTVAAAIGALAVGSIGTAVLLAIGTYFFGKLLVMLVVWPVRGLKRRSAAKRGQPRPKTGPASGATAAAGYPSMPMPPMGKNDSGRRGGRRRRMPLWGEFAVVAAVLAIGAPCVGLGAVAAAGGPEQLLAQAGVSDVIPLLAVDGDEVDTIDLTPPAEAEGRLASISMGTSPDDNVYVRGWCEGAYGLMFWGDRGFGLVEAVQDGRTVRLAAERSPAVTVQNLLTVLGTEYVYGESDQVVVLVPEGWEGDVVCADGSVRIVAGGASTGDALGWEGEQLPNTGLTIDGDVELGADVVNLVHVQANAVDLVARYVNMYEVDAETLSVNAGEARGQAYIANTKVGGDVELGGQQVTVDGLAAQNVDVGERTRLVEEAPVEKTGELETAAAMETYGDSGR